MAYDSLGRGLPKWALDEITRLERRVAELEEQVDAANNPRLAKVGEFYYEDRSRGQKRAKDAQIALPLGEFEARVIGLKFGDRWDESITMRMEEYTKGTNLLTIHSVDGALIIVGNSSNAVRLAPARSLGLDRF